MNAFITDMSNDMNIAPYVGETNAEFVYRLCYSALGLWCLNVARNSINGVVGTSKHNQTVILDDLITQYKRIYPNIANKFGDGSSDKRLPVQIRRVYEETGYLLTGNDRNIILAEYRRSVFVGSKRLFFGIPNEILEMNGLGVYSPVVHNSASISEILIRDNLATKEYFSAQFDPCEFIEKDLEMDQLQYFDPLAETAPSSSWKNCMTTDCTVCRKNEYGPYYRVMRQSDGLLIFADELFSPQNDNLTAYDYRRLYFAIKDHYGNPLLAWINKIDDKYSHLKLSGYLPNREYYFILLSAWPQSEAFDKISFIIRNELISAVSDVLKHIGIAIIGGTTYA